MPQVPNNFIGTIRVIFDGETDPTELFVDVNNGTMYVENLRNLGAEMPFHYIYHTDKYIHAEMGSCFQQDSFRYCGW